MFPQENREPVDNLTDTDVLEFIADLPAWELSLVQRMLIQAELFGIDDRRRACEIIMRTSPSIEGRRAEQIVEALRARAEQQRDPDAAVDVPRRDPDQGPNGNKKRSLFSGWSIGGGGSD